LTWIMGRLADAARSLNRELALALRYLLALRKTK
jgi:hypothetical protein